MQLTSSIGSLVSPGYIHSVIIYRNHKTQGTTMVASAVFIMDTKGKVIIARNYRGDIPMSVSERWVNNLSSVTVSHP